MLDCAVPTDVIAFASTNRDMFTKYGKPRMKKEQMRWSNIKAVYQWEALTGGPLWNFPENNFQETVLGPLAVKVADEEFVTQSKNGVNELTFDVQVPTNARVKQGTYEAIIKRALGNRLTAKEVPSYEITLKEYNADGDSTFTVVHKVLDGDKEAVLDRAVAAELAVAKAHVASAILQSQSITERAAGLKE